MYLIIKYLVTAGIVVAVSEFAKRSDKLGALVASLPLVTVLTLIWLYVENQAAEKLSRHMSFTFWYVLPTLPMFLLFPWLLGKFGFWLALLMWLVTTILVFLIYAIGLKKLGIDLL
ncbi:MAG: DUF3147 family protein [Formosimonas sp.]